MVDLGCGEGVVTRLLGERGYEVVGVDIAPTAVRIAAEADPDGRYVVGDLTALPFEDATFDLAVARLSLQDVEDVDAAVGEAARILRPEGKLCFSVFHPVRAIVEAPAEQHETVPLVLALRARKS